MSHPGNKMFKKQKENDFFVVYNYKDSIERVARTDPETESAKIYTINKPFKT